MAFASLLADLGRLRREAPQGGDVLTAEAFQSAYEAEPCQRGINIGQLDDVLSSLFNGSEAAYRHFVAYLDGFPPSARMAAYVRSADAVMTLQRLRQSVS